MKSLTLFEIKKLFNIPFLKLFFVLLVAVNTFNIYSNYDTMLTPEKAIIGSVECEPEAIRYKMDNDFQGKITAESVKAAKDHFQNCKSIADGNTQIKEKLYYPLAYTDMVQSKEIIEEMERLYKYNSDVISPLLKNNEKLKGEARLKKDNYAIKTAELIDETYSARDLENYYRVNEYEPLLSYKLSSLCILLLSCFAGAYMFSGEKEKAMNSMIRCTKNGKRKIYFSKLAALFIFCALCAAIFFYLDFLIFHLCRRPSGIFEPIYALKDYTYSPLNISVLGFYLLVSALKLFGIFAVSLFAFFFSSVFKRSYVSLLCAVFSLFLFMYSGLYTDGIFSVLRYFNPLSLVTVTNLFKTLMLKNVFGVPVLSTYLHIVGVLLVGVTVVVATYSLSIRRSPNNA